MKQIKKLPLTLNRIPVRMTIDTKTLRQRGIGIPSDVTPGEIMICVLDKATPTQFKLLERTYRSYSVTIDRRTGIQLSGSIVGYRMSKSDLKKLNALVK